MSAERPLKRADLSIDEAASGFVINDTGRGRVHYLNHTAALIFELCDGQSSVEDIAELVRQAFNLPESPEDLVRAQVTRLTQESLVA